MRKLMSVLDVAEALGVKEPTVRKWILERKIKFVKIGAFVRFNPEYIEKIMEEGLK